MKRHKYKQNSNYFWIAGIAVVIIIVLILIFSGGKKTQDEQNDTFEDENFEPVFEVVNEDQEITEVFKEEVAKELKEDSKEVAKGNVGEEGLCEDYFFEQEDELKINGHSIIVERVGKGGLRLVVDDKHYVMNEGDSDYLGDGIRLSIEDGNILYFGADDPDNAVMMRVGCHYNDNPNEKYVERRGESICKKLSEYCEESFGLE